MSDRSCNDAQAAVADAIAQARSLVLLTHARSDGDALGSIIALARAARNAGRHATLVATDPLPDTCADLTAGTHFEPAAEFPRLAQQADLIVLVDTCSYSQLDTLAQPLRDCTDKVVVLDHHATHDPIGRCRWIDPSAAAAGVMTLELLDTLGWPLDPPAARALAWAIVCDTGWMRFSNADGRCLRAMARLLDAGVKPDELYKTIFQTDRPERLRLLARVLGTLETSCGGRLAVMTCRKGDFAATGAAPAETENFVNEPLRIGAVEASVLLVENGDVIRVSLRSRGAVDVAAVAKAFGGGGHVRAAGLRQSGDLDELKSKLIAVFAQQL